MAADVFAKYGLPDLSAPGEEGLPYGMGGGPTGALRRYVADPLVSALKGALLVPQTAVGIADIPTMGYAGKALESAGVDLNKAQQIAETLYSPEQQAANRTVMEAQGVGPTLAAIVQNPSVIPHQVIQQAPQMLGGGLISRGLLRLAAGAAPAATAPAAALAARAEQVRRLAPYAGAAGEGIVTAGQNLEQVRAEEPTGLVTPQQVALNTLAGAITGGIAGVGGKVSQRLGLVDPETLLAAGLTKEGLAAATAGKQLGLARRIGGGAISEGLFQEFPQSYQEQVFQNLSQGKPWDESAAQQAVLGGIVGGVMGGGANVMPQTPRLVPPPRLALPAPGAIVPPPLGPTPDTTAADAYAAAVEQARAAEEARLAGLQPPRPLLSAPPPPAPPAPPIVAPAEGGPFNVTMAHAQQNAAENAARVEAARTAEDARLAALGMPAGGLEAPAATVVPPAAAAPAVAPPAQPVTDVQVRREAEAAAIVAAGAGGPISTAAAEAHLSGAVDAARVQQAVAAAAEAPRGTKAQPVEGETNVQVARPGAEVSRPAQPGGNLPEGGRGVGQGVEGENGRPAAAAAPEAGVGGAGPVRAGAAGEGEEAGLIARHNALVGEWRTAKAVGDEAAMGAAAAGIEQVRQRQMTIASEAFKRGQAGAATQRQTEAAQTYGAMPVGTKIGVIGHEQNDNVYWHKTGTDEWTRNGIGSERPTIPNAQMEGDRQIETKQNFGSTQVALPPALSALVKRTAKAVIAPADVEAEHGLEDRPHVTVKYGLHGNVMPDAVRALVENEPPITGTIGKLEVFSPEGKNYDVLVARVESPDLHRLNAKIAGALPVTDTHPVYKPHVTLGYVKRGQGAKYAAAKNPLAGKTFEINTLEFSDQNEKVTAIPLEGKPLTAGQRAAPYAAATAPRAPALPSRGLNIEVAPNPNDQTLTGRFNRLTESQKKEATYEASDKIIHLALRDAGIGEKDFSIEHTIGGFEGKTNPSIIIRFSPKVTYDEMVEAGKVLGHVFSQKAIIVYDEALTAGPDITGFVKVEGAKPLTYDQQSRLFKQMVAQFPEAAGFTGHQGSLVFGNYTKFGPNPLSDADFKGKIDAVLAKLPESYVTSQHAFRSDYIEPVTLEGTRYGSNQPAAQAGGTGVRGQGYLDTLRSRTGRILESHIAAAEEAALSRRLAGLGRALTDEERALLTEARSKRLVALMDELPSTADYVHAALAGQAQRGWYQRTRVAVEGMYGRDAPRFLSLMAALSPQNDVRGNFYNTARVWAAWLRAGRPTDRAVLQRIFDENLLTPEGVEDAKSAMEAWTNNSYRALTTETPESTPLSGPKVESFRQNLQGNLGEVTNDRHQAAFSGIKQTLLGGLRRALGDAFFPDKGFGIKSPGYIALSARTRQAAAELTRLTGEQWQPAEAQETIWSFWKALYDLATATGETRSALQLLRAGALTHEMVRRVPDLGGFFHEEEFRGITRGAEQGLDVAPERAAELYAGRAQPAGQTGPIAANPVLERIARRADRLIADRRAAAEANAAAGEVGQPGAPYADPYATAETRPGTTEAQKDAGRAALAAAERRIFGPPGLGLRGRATLLGSRIAAAFRAQGGLTLVGQEVRGAQDLATVAQVLRDPRFETFRVFYVDSQDRIVGEGAYSSRLAGTVYIPRDILDKINAETKRLATSRFGKVRYWVLHNHPGGSAMTSDQDRDLTNYLKHGAAGFAGHVIIDHDQYYHFQPNGSEDLIQAPQFKAKALADVGLEVPHELIGRRVQGPQGAAAIAAQLQKRDGYVTIIGTSGSQGRIGLITEVPVSALQAKGKVSRLRLLAALRRAVRETGSSSLLFAVTPNEASSRDYMLLRNAGVFTDVISGPTGESMLQSGKMTPRIGTDVPASAVEKRGAKSPNLPTWYAKQEGPGYTGPTWYSALQRAMPSAPWSKSGDIDAAQLTRWIDARTKDGTFKRDEVEWSGLGDYLKALGGKVARTDVDAFLQANGVRVEETVLGGDEKTYAAAADRLRADGFTINSDDYFGVQLVRDGEDIERDQLNARQRADLETLNAGMEAEAPLETGSTKFASYQLPGGKNYRELLLTLPDTKTAMEEAKEFSERMEKKYGPEYRNTELTDAERLEDDTLARKIFAERGRAPPARFDAGHYGEVAPNVLAHIRFNDRTDADGKRVLFIEEIQSDWAQKGRKEGFDADGAIPSGYGVGQNKDTGNWYFTVNDPVWNESAKKGSYDTRADAERGARTHSRGGATAIPSAPFVGKTEAWTALAMKRMIRYAAEHGYARVAWTTGEQQSSRYDLSKQVSRIYLIDPVYDGDTGKFLRGHLSASDLNGGTVIDKTVTAQELPDIIGKDAAERLVNNPTRKEGDDVHVLQGTDLKVGGEGMKGFYDKIVPNVANDVLRKLGGGKVDEVQVFGGQIPAEPVAWGDAHERATHPERFKAETLKQPGFDITPQLRERAMQGMPLFQPRAPYDQPPSAEAIAPAEPLTVAQPMPQWVAARPAAEQEALRKVGLWAPQMTWKQKVNSLLANGALRATQGLVDAFAPIKELSERAYMLARLTKSSDAGLESLMRYGTLKLNDAGAIDIKTPQQGGFIGVMQKLNGEHDRFFAWIAGERAAELKRPTPQFPHGRENNLTDTDISVLRDLNQGTMADGTSRQMLYGQVHAELNRYSKSILDIAEKAGIINADDRAIWEKDFYVPFYRVLEDEGYTGPRNVGGLTNQHAFKKLKGGTQVTADLLQNTLRNWSHLLSASLKNQAATRSLESAEQAGIAYPIAQHEAGKGDPFILRDGRKEYWRVEDPYVLDAIVAMETSPFTGIIPSTMGKFKYALTLGVTISPTFRVRNLIRDSLQAIATNPMNYNVLDNLVTGWKATDIKMVQYGRMLAGGALMHFGTGLEGDSATHTKRLVNAGIADATVLDTKEKLADAFTKAWDWWEQTGSRSENMNRAAIYQQVYDRSLAEGKTPDEAHLYGSYAARDSMDFSLMGSWPAVRLLAQVVPFFNARMQGMYKLGREGFAPATRVLYNTVTGQPVAASDKQRAMRFGAVVGGVTLAGIALFLAYRDDEDFKRREEWDRDQYWWFKIGGQAYRIPKPFEVGALASLAERGLELMLAGMDAESRRRFVTSLQGIISNNLSMSAIPQAVSPLLSVYANKDSFTGRPIETMGMEKLSKPERIGQQTSVVAQLAGKAGGITRLSPVQIDELIQGYFGWLGAHAVMTADLGLRPLLGYPSKPAMKLGDVFTVGDFVKDLPSNQSRFVTEFYDQAVTVQEAYADWRHAVALGEFDKAKALGQDPNIALHGMFAHAQRSIGMINVQIRRIEASDAEPDTKRARIDALTAQKQRLAEAAVTARQRAEAGRR